MNKKPYPKWVGIIFGFVLCGSAHFLSGHKKSGIIWNISILVCGFLVICIMAVPGSIAYFGGVFILFCNVILWLIMLKQSYRPVRRIGILGWCAVLAIMVLLNTAIQSGSRLIVHSFKVPTGAMEPTIYGVHTREASAGNPPKFWLLTKLLKGEKYIEWYASKSGVFEGPYLCPPNMSPWCGYKLGSDSRLLPCSAQVHFTHGDQVPVDDLIWSGFVIAGDHLLVEKVSYFFRAPRRGEIVVFKTDGVVDEYPGSYFVFRVAGLPGERVQIVPTHLVIDGERITDPPIFAKIASKEDGYLGFRSSGAGGKSVKGPFEEIVLDDNEYFVLGDNTENAYDSRYWGPLPRENIIGRVTRIYWPFSRLNALEVK